MKANKYTSPEEKNINLSINIALMEVANILSDRSIELARYPTDAAIQKIKTHTEIIELLKTKMK
jgi:hypothetical protein